MTVDAAIRADAERRLEELRAVRAALMPDRDDARVMSELSSIDRQIARAAQVVAADRVTGEAG